MSAARLEHRPTGVPEVDELASTLQTVLARYDEQAARTAEALDTARSFAASASHELRTPLMSMRINLDVLDGTPAPGDLERAEIVADLRAEHERLLGLLVMLRALAQGDLVAADAFTAVDLAELADAAVADLRRARPEARVTLDLSPGCVVHGWPQGLRSAVDNLLTNAVVHGAGPGGTASLHVTVRAAAGGSAVELLVDDRGPGIPPDVLPYIFARFTRRATSPGSGLGLALVAQQAALHHGSVTPSPRLPTGTRFTLRLPRTPAPGTRATAPLRRAPMPGA